MDAALAPARTVLLGRVTLEQWAAYWPTSPGDDFADFINPVEKPVVSRTLTGDLEWRDARLLGGDLERSVAELRAGDGGDVLVCGSISGVRALLFAGLLDRLTLITHPVVAGTGRRLFEAGDPHTRPALVDSTRTSAGDVVTTYTRR